MLVILVLQVLGLIAFGLIIAPLLFHSTGTGFAVLSISVTTLIRLTRAKRPKAFGKVFKKFLWSTARVVPQGNKAKRKICPPDRFHGSGVYREDGRYAPPVCDLKRQHYPEGRTNKYRLNTPNQQVANKLKKLRNALHSVVTFYRSYYGRSTKVEENPVRCFDPVVVTRSSRLRGNVSALRKRLGWADPKDDGAPEHGLPPETA